MDHDEEEEMNNIVIDDYNDDDRYQASTVQSHDHGSIKNSADHLNRENMDDNTFDTYDFVDPGAIYYNVDNGRQLAKFCVKNSQLNYIKYRIRPFVI